MALGRRQLLFLIGDVIVAQEVPLEPRVEPRVFVGDGLVMNVWTVNEPLFIDLERRAAAGRLNNFLTYSGRDKTALATRYES